MEIKSIDIVRNSEYTDRNELKKELIKCIKEIFECCFPKTFTDEDIAIFAEELSEAMIQDMEVKKYVCRVWKECILDSGNSDERANTLEAEKISKEIAGRVCHKDKMYVLECKNENYNGLASYTLRYPVLKDCMVYEVLKENFTKMEMEIAPKLYQSAYPVFWLESINVPFSKRREKQHMDNSFLPLITDGMETEMYLFALLLNERTSVNIANSRIFAAVRRSLNHILKGDKEELNMDSDVDRWRFVEKLRKKVHEEGSKAIKEKKVFINNVVTMRELIEIGNDCGLKDVNRPLMLTLLESLTGWIGFYNYVSLGEGTTGDYMDDMGEMTDEEINAFIEKKQLLEEELAKKMEDNLNKIQIQIENFLPITDAEKFLKAYESARDLLKGKDFYTEIYSGILNETKEAVDEVFWNIGKGRIALLYCIAKWIRGGRKSQADGKIRGSRDEETIWNFADVYQSCLGRIFLGYISELGDAVEGAFQWEQNSDVQPECGWYNLLYDELFVNDIDNVQEATRFEALNYYSMWRRTTE